MPDKECEDIGEQRARCCYPNLLLKDSGDCGDRCPPPEDFWRMQILSFLDERFDPRFQLALAVSVCLARCSL